MAFFLSAYDIFFQFIWSFFCQYNVNDFEYIVCNADDGPHEVFSFKIHKSGPVHVPIINKAIVGACSDSIVRKALMPVVSFGHP